MIWNKQITEITLRKNNQQQHNKILFGMLMDVNSAQTIC